MNPQVVGLGVVCWPTGRRRGGPREGPLRVALAVSAGALLELGFSGGLVERDGALVLAGASAPADPAAAAVAEHVRSHPGGTPREWLLAVREQALGMAYEGLMGKGLVRERRRRVFGVFGSVTYPVTGVAELAALRERLAAVRVQGHGSDERAAALVTLLDHAGLQAGLPQASEAEATGTEAPGDRPVATTEGQRMAAALGDEIRTTVAALTVAIGAAAL
ncbi:GPP34 family phosphoprotein [Streptomyces sp. NPDC005435]|uniref:GOLPH3/VPS74 family protein n=1 Tax=Streptomyces sp. NPDC005435 TaxID=3154464 RepID=UPI003451E7D3